MKLMSTHLDHIEKALSEPGPPSPDDDLAVLLPAPARKMRKASS
jgi:hypothetical protein